MNVEEQTAKNSLDIGTLTATVNKLALTFEFAEQRNKEGREDVRTMVAELKTLNDKIGSMSGFGEGLAKTNGEISTLRHDLRNVEQIVSGIQLVRNQAEKNAKDVAVLLNDVASLKQWRDKHDGASDALRSAARAMWAVGGTGILAVVGFVLYSFFTQGYHSMTQKTGPAVYLKEKPAENEHKK